MQSHPQRFIIVGHISLTKKTKNRKTLQMPVLTIHDQTKKSKLKHTQNQIQRYSSNKDSKFHQQNRVSSADINILETIRQQKNYEMYKKLNPYVLAQSQKAPRNLHYKKKRSDSLYNRLQNLKMQRLKLRLQKIEIKTNINLISLKKQKNCTQRFLAKLIQINQQNLSQSLSCKQMLVHHSKSRSNNNNKNRELRSKISVKNNQRQKFMSRSLQSKPLQELCNDQFQSWKTEQKQEQTQDFKYCSMD